MDPFTIVVAVGWLLVGLIVGLWMVRRGHDPRWVPIAMALGPIFIPIALERVERLPRLAASGPDGSPGGDDDSPNRPRVLVGVDGSPESQQALARVVELLGSRCRMLVLAEVVWHDAMDEMPRTALAAATDRLTSAAAAVRSGTDVAFDVRFEVLAGSPAEALRRFAEDQGMDLLVVGRRGHGRSPHLLGSVSSDLVRHAHLPVLVVEPESTTVHRKPPESAARGAGTSSP